MAADIDGSNTLSLSEFKEVMRMADLGLSDREVSRVLAEADVNDDGVIDYAEFVPLAVDLVQGLYARADAQLEADETEHAAREQAQQYMLHGMTKAQLEALMADVFHKADADGNGYLTMQEFHNCIREADLGLTRKEVNTLMTQVDADRDGKVTYEEFAPLCFDILTEILKEELLQEAKKQPNELEEYLVAVCSSFDESQEYKLTLQQMRDALRQCDFGLTRLQIHTVLAEAEEDEDGYVDYAAFAAKMSDMIYRLLDPEAMYDRHMAVTTLMSNAPDSELVQGQDSAGIEQVLLDECQAVDPDGMGVLPHYTLRDVLTKSSLSLGPKDVNALMSCVDIDPSGMAAYYPLCSYAFNILHSLAIQAQL